MKRIVLIGLLLISFNANAQQSNCPYLAFENQTLSQYALLGCGMLRNAGELFSHGYNIAQSPYSKETIYHGIELMGHGFNIADYANYNSWQASTALVIFNAWAATMQFSSIRKNTKIKTPMAIAAAAFGSLDFIGHVVDLLYTARSVAVKTGN